MLALDEHAPRPCAEMHKTEMPKTEMPKTEMPKTELPKKKPGKQGRGRRLTDKERMEIIELTRQNPRIRHVELALRYSVNESTIRKWRLAANAEKIEMRYSTGAADVRDKRQRGQVLKSTEFDAALFAWVAAQRAQSVELSPTDLRTKARDLANSFPNMHEFKASSGWYYRFCRRYGLSCTGARPRPATAATAAATATTAATAEVTAQNTAAAIAIAAALKSSSGDALGSASDGSLSSSSGSSSSGGRLAQDQKKDELQASSSEIDTSIESLDVAVYDAASAPPTAVSLKRKLDDALRNAGDAADGSSSSRSNGAVRQRRAAATPRVPAAPSVAKVSAASSTAPVTPARSASSALQTTSTTTRSASPAQPTTSTPMTPVSAVTLPTSAPVTPSPLATASPGTTVQLSVRQEAIAHFQQHHKHLLGVRDRLRFIKHLAHTSEDAEMYTVMDDETRVEFIKEFSSSSSSSGSPHASASVAAHGHHV